MTMACRDARKGAIEAAGRVVQRDQDHELAEARMEVEGCTSMLDA
jgi:hypothetical protein